MNNEGRHFLAIRDLKRQALLNLLDLAGTFMRGNGKSLKKVPLLRGKTVVNLFSNPVPVRALLSKSQLGNFPPMS